MQMEIIQKFNDFSERQSTASELKNRGVHLLKREIETTLVLNDGEIAVLGGLMVEKETKNESKVPVLGDIPILGWLFKGSASKRQKNNLLVFIKPTIIKGKSQKEDTKKLFGKKLEERIHFVKKYMKGRDPHGHFIKSLKEPTLMGDPSSSYPLPTESPKDDVLIAPYPQKTIEKEEETPPFHEESLPNTELKEEEIEEDSETSKERENLQEISPEEIPWEKKNTPVTDKTEALEVSSKEEVLKEDNENPEEMEEMEEIEEIEEMEDLEDMEEISSEVETPSEKNDNIDSSVTEEIMPSESIPTEKTQPSVTGEIIPSENFPSESVSTEETPEETQPSIIEETPPFENPPSEEESFLMEEPSVIKPSEGLTEDSQKEKSKDSNGESTEEEEIKEKKKKASEEDEDWF